MSLVTSYISLNDISCDSYSFCRMNPTCHSKCGVFERQCFWKLKLKWLIQIWLWMHRCCSRVFFSLWHQYFYVFGGPEYFFHRLLLAEVAGGQVNPTSSLPTHVCVCLWAVDFSTPTPILSQPCPCQQRLWQLDDPRFWSRGVIEINMRPWLCPGSALLCRCLNEIFLNAKRKLFYLQALHSYLFPIWGYICF